MASKSSTADPPLMNNTASGYSNFQPRGFIGSRSCFFRVSFPHESFRLLYLASFGSPEKVCKNPVLRAILRCSSSRLMIRSLPEQSFTLRGKGIRCSQLRTNSHDMATSNNYTLLDLVQTGSRYAKTENEALATITYLINSGKVSLRGNFAGAKIDLSASSAKRVRRRADRVSFAS